MKLTDRSNRVQMSVDSHGPHNEMASEHGPSHSPSREPSALLSLQSRFRSGLQFDYALVLAALLITLIGFLFGEKIQFGGGLGMDGQEYGAWARDFYNSVFVVGLDNMYSLQGTAVIIASVLLYLFYVKRSKRIHG